MANVKCPKCNNLITNVYAGQTVKCTKCGHVMKLASPSTNQTTATTTTKAKSKAKTGMPMRTWKLVSGIISIILFIIVSFQSCAAGLGNAISNNGEVSGSAGAIVSIMLLTGGIVSICVRKGGKGGNIALIVLYGIATFFGFLLAGSFGDLYVWSFWCLVCMVLAIISLVKS